MQNLICSKHAQVILFFDKSQSDPQLKYMCIQCITDLMSNLVQIQVVQEKLEEFKSQLIYEKEALYQQNILVINDIKQNVFQIKEQLDRLLIKYIGYCDEQMKIISDSENKCKKQIEYLSTTNIDSFVNQYQQIEKQFINYSDIKKLLLENFDSILQLPFTQQIQQSFNSLKVELSNFKDNFSQLKTQFFQADYQKQKTPECKIHVGQVVQKAKQKIQESQLNSLRFDLLQSSKVSQSEKCRAIAINKGCSQLVAGCESQIKVFEFKQGMLKQIQILSEHKQDVSTLNFMENQNQFISGSYDSSIIIWQNKQNNQWISQYKLNGHTKYISCLIVNYNEDLIVSGSPDFTIKFWMKKNQWLCQQTITHHSHYVFGLSLNQQQNRIISCGEDKQILIIEQSQQNKEWIVIQNIKVEQHGYRICFIDNNMFTFQPCNKEQMAIFEMNSMNKQYIQIQQVSVKGGKGDFPTYIFPQQYINSKCILVNKNGEYVNLIRKKQNGEFLTQQSIHFGTPSIFGVMSEDGEYLITWDDISKQIQIRKYNEV